MIHPFPIVYRRLAEIVVALLLSSVFAGCATTGTGEQVYEYQKSSRYVRMEAIEANAPANNHPYSISAQTLQSLMSGLTAAGNVSLSGEAAVFEEEELTEVVEHIVTALAKARPDQDVTFQSASPRGFFGKYSLPAFTTGRVFARDGRLNIILGAVHVRPDPDNVDIDSYRYPAGSRSGRIESGWELVSGTGQLVDGRGDWISFTNIPASESEPSARQAKGSPAQSADPQNTRPDGTDVDSSVESRSRKIESRLRVLDELKAKQLITDDEYAEQRKAILQGI